MYPHMVGHGSAPITITQVANAWLVVLPDVQQMMPAMPSFDMDTLIKRGIDLAHEKMEGDDVMAKIRKENEPEPNRKSIKMALPKISDLKDENVFSFKTFPEVLEFLAERIK